MAKTIMNEADLEATLSNIARDVIYEVTEKTYDRLQEIIQEKVYDAHIPNWYARLEDDGGLKGAWVYNVEGGKKTVTGEVKHMPMLMIYNPENYQHGSYAFGDVRDSVASYIEAGFGWGVGRRPFWATMIEELDRGSLDRWIMDGFKKRGLKIRKV